MSKQHFESIGVDSLADVTGATSHTNAQLTAMLTQISSSIKDVANNKNQNQIDPMMMMMMMMMGGSGGGSQVVAAPPPQVAPNVIRVSIGGRRRWW